MKKKTNFLLIIALIFCLSTVIVLLIIFLNKSENLVVVDHNGLSTYELAVEKGYKGSVQEWISDISDKSSYDVIKNNGFNGSESEWINMIDEDEDVNKEMIGIKSAEISEEGELLIVLTDDRKINVGKTVGTVEQELIKEILVTKSNELIVVTGDSKKYNMGIIKGNKSNTKENENIIDAAINDCGQLDITLANGNKTESQSNQIKTPSICVGKVEAKAGATVDVPVSIYNNPGINGAQIDISYDSKLKLIDAQNGKALRLLNFTATGDYTNPSKFLWDGLNDNEKGNGVALLLTFEVPSNVKVGDSLEVSVSYTTGSIYDVDLNDIEFKTINGSITIL